MQYLIDYISTPIIYKFRKVINRILMLKVQLYSDFINIQIDLSLGTIKNSENLLEAVPNVKKFESMRWKKLHL